MSFESPRDASRSLPQACGTPMVSTMFSKARLVAELQLQESHVCI